MVKPDGSVVVVECFGPPVMGFSGRRCPSIFVCLLLQMLRGRTTHFRNQRFAVEDRKFVAKLAGCSARSGDSVKNRKEGIKTQQECQAKISRQLFAAIFRWVLPLVCWSISVSCVHFRIPRSILHNLATEKAELATEASGGSVSRIFHA